VDNAAEVGGGCSGASGGGSATGSSPSMVSSGRGWERLRRLGRAPVVDDGAEVSGGCSGAGGSGSAAGSSFSLVLSGGGGWEQLRNESTKQRAGGGGNAVSPCTLIPITCSVVPNK
jgi:hypothetical protein